MESHSLSRGHDGLFAAKITTLLLTENLCQCGRQGQELLVSVLVYLCLQFLALL